MKRRSVHLFVRIRRYTPWSQIRRGQHHYAVSMEHDVRYSNVHPRNVMDVYKPVLPNEDGAVLNPYRHKSVLFVHGGMWIRGDKVANHVSIYDAFAHAFGAGRSQSKAVSFSNVGKTFAEFGITAYVMNYQLECSTMKEPLYRKQVIDVSRGVSFVLHREEQRCRQHGLDSPQIYLMGHSAGAHLLALSLVSSSKWLNDALNKNAYLSERTLEYISGFIGISGPYNLHRLKMDSMSPFTVDPAFGNNSFDLKEASPLHALLQTDDHLSLLGYLPILLLNAEDDFHLAQDSKELLVALDRKYHSTLLQRIHQNINGTSHLSIIRDFEPESSKDDENQTVIQSLTETISSYSHVFSNRMNSEYHSALHHVLDFIGIK